MHGVWVRGAERCHEEGSQVGSVDAARKKYANGKTKPMVYWRETLTTERAFNEGKALRKLVGYARVCVGKPNQNQIEVDLC